MPLDDVLDEAQAAVLAEHGLTRLRALATEIGLAQDAEARAELFAAFMRDGDAVDELACAQVVRAFDLERELAAVRAQIPAKLADRLERIVRRRAAEMEGRRKGIRLVKPGAAPPPGPSLAKALGAPAAWPDYPVPAGYQVTPQGIAHDDVLVVADPVMVIGGRVDVVSGRESVVLGFQRHSTWRRLVLPRSTARDARALLAHSDDGLDVESNNARDVVSWLRACEAVAGGVLPIERSTVRTGWHDDEYVAGPNSCGIELEDPDDLRRGWRPAGTWSGWLEALEVIETEPAAWLILYSAALAPLLRWMELGHCPIVDLSGPRGRGKTTCLRLAGSGWGRPDDGPGGTILTWDSSPTNVERMAARTWDAPLLLDDTKRARRPGDVTSALYALAQGRGRGRATPGGIQQTATWRTVAISTGEAALIEATEAGGARARVLSVTITPAISSLRIAKRLEAGISANYGHLGPRMASRALELGDELRERYHAELQAQARAMPLADTRLLSTVAALHVAHGVTREIGVPEPECDWPAALREALVDAVAEADQGRRALDLVREELASFTALYRRRADDLVPPGGGRWRGTARELDDFIGIYPEVLRKLLHDAGHDPRPVLARWAEEGVIVCNLDFRYEFGVSAAWNVSRKERVYAFRLSALQR